MPNVKPKSLDWLDDLAALSAQLEKTPDATHEELAKALNTSRPTITLLLAIKPVFDPEAIQKIQQAALAATPYILSLNSAKALIGLKKAKAGDLTAFHAALDVILARNLATKDIKKLAAWMVSGKPAELFDPKAKLGKIKEKPLTSVLPIQDEDLEQLKKLINQVEEEKARGDGQTTHQDKLKALLEKGTVETEESGDNPVISPGKKGKTGKKSKSSSDDGPSLFWEWMLGVKFMNQLKSKAKKGTLTTTDKILILLDKGLVGPLGWVLKHLGKLLKASAKDFWHWLKHTLGKTFSQIIQWAIPLLIICALIWGAGKVYQYAILNPLHWVESKVKSGFHWGGSNTEEPVTPVPTPQPVVLTLSPKKSSGTSTSSRSQTASVIYQPAVSFAPNPASTQTLYDPKILDLEIKSLPDNYVVVKDYPLTPDEGMPVDVAVSRMQDITDSDKYTMMIGGGKQIISSVNPTNTTLTVQYKSADPFGLLGGGNGIMNFLWEDVKYIHTNEIDVETKNPTVIYQCSLVVSGSKYPLTIQCATPDDLEHLVSTMQYFIRHSRLSHDTALAGMPYLHQGLVFGDDLVVKKLWANSPADKAGLQLSDHLWNVGKATSDQQEKKVLEAGLQSLPATLFAVSDADWGKAVIAKNSNMTPYFHPKLRQVLLGAL